MKILFVPSDNNATSGAFLSMVKLCSLLQNEHQCEILVLLHCDGNGEELLKANNINYRKIYSFNWFVPYRPKTIIRKMKKALCYVWMPLTRMYNRLVIKKIQRLIASEDIDVVHINTSCCYVAAQAALNAGIPYLWHIREFLEEDQARCIWNKKVGYELISKADRVIAISQSIYEKYKRLLSPHARLTTIYNGIDARDFAAESNELFATDHIQMCIVGSINQKKGQDQAIRTCQKLINEGFQNFTLRIAGKESEYAKQLRKYVQRRGLEKWIEFIGPQSDVAKLYHQSDIALMCSQAEAFGRVTVEAMMSGCLLIGADAGGTKELVENEVTGLLYPSGDVDALKERIKYAFDHKLQMRGIAEQGKKRMLETMTAQSNADQVYKVYKSVLCDKRS